MEQDKPLRKASSRKARVPADKRGARKDGTDALQARVERLESSLSQAQQRNEELESLGSSGINIPKAVSSFSLELPTLPEVSSAVEKYLKTVNCILPLFHPETLQHRIRTWFEHRTDQRDCNTWAAVNVVLALAHRRMPADTTTPDRNVAHFLNNAQSVLNEIIMSKASLLNVQILVGMVMLYQGTLDLKPAAILIAVAIRLAHELGLHSRNDDAEHLDPATRSERDRVFWIAYILDRDISLRTRRPPVQRLADIGIDWPSAEPEDGAGIVLGMDGISKFNFFLSRVKLAHIQAEVYEAMFSTRAQTLDTYERLENTSGLHRMLDEWIASVPPQFRPSAVLQSTEPSLCRAFGILYATHLACRVWVSRAHIMGSAWHQNLQEFGRQSVQEGVLVAVPALPRGWNELVSDSREYMRLFMGIEWKDPAFIWMTACTYIMSSACLTANNMLNPRHESADNDGFLADICFSFLEDMIHQAPFEPLKRARDALEELLKYARAASLQASI